MLHECVQEDYWDMRANVFGVGCIDCLQPPDTTLLSDCFRIPVTPAKKRRMETAQTKGMLVWTDGSDTLAWNTDHWCPLFAFLSDAEWGED